MKMTTTDNAVYFEELTKEEVDYFIEMAAFWEFKKRREKEDEE